LTGQDFLIDIWETFCRPATLGGQPLRVLPNLQ